MKYNQPYGAPGANDPYINGNPSTGTMGSIPPAASIEYPQREIVEVIAAGGLTPDNADLTQLAKAIQGGKIIFGGTSANAGNAFSASVSPVPNALTVGMCVVVKMNAAPTGPATFALIRSALPTSFAEAARQLAKTNGRLMISLRFGGPVRNGRPVPGPVRNRAA
jgi:hypothetical protein